MFTMSTTSAVKSTPLLPETAGLAEISPRKEETRKDKVTKITEITSNYLFNSSDIVSNGMGFSGTSVADFGITLNPISLNIFVHDIEKSIHAKGLTISPLDLLIGATAKTNGAILISNDAGYERIDGLKLRKY